MLLYLQLRASMIMLFVFLVQMVDKNENKKLGIFGDMTRSVYLGIFKIRGIKESSIFVIVLYNVLFSVIAQLSPFFLIILF